METSIKKYSEIGLILFDLLNQDYDCTKKCIETLKNVEMNDAIKYDIERYKNKHIKFSTHSFLYTLQGSMYFSGVKRRRNRIIERPPNKSSMYHTEADKYEILISKYDEILNTPNISQKQRDIILKMKNNRISKYLNGV
jgi:hypothetical protein